MDQKQSQEYKGINSQHDLWDEYLEEKEEKKEVDTKPHISKQIEEDLLEYEYLKSREPKRNARSLPLIGLLIAVIGMVSMITFSRISYTNNSDSYYEVIENVEEINEDIYEDIYGDYSLLKNPYFDVNGKYYELPVKVSELLNDNEYVIATDAFQEAINEVGEDPVKVVIKTEWGDKVCDAMVVSEGGVVPIEEGKIIGISIDRYSEIALPTDIGLYSNSWEIEDILSQYNIEWTSSGQGKSSQYIIKNELNNGSEYKSYDIQLNLTNDNVSDITILLNND